MISENEYWHSKAGSLPYPEDMLAQIEKYAGD